VGTRFLPDLKPLDALHPPMVVCDIHRNDLYAIYRFSASAQICWLSQSLSGLLFLTATNRGDHTEKREMEMAQMKLFR